MKTHIGGRGLRQKLTLTGVAAVSAASILGGSIAAYAQTSSGSTNTATPSAVTAAAPTPADRSAQEDAYLSALASNLGISVDALKAAMKTTSLGLIDKAVADGTMTSDQATAAKARIEAGDLNFGFGGGPGRGGRGGDDHGPRGGGIANPDALATFLGVTADQVRTELQSGSTLAEVAAAHGKSRDDLKAFLVSEQQTHLAQAVTDGHLTQTEADAKLADFQSKVDTLIDSAGFMGGPGGHGPMGGGPGGAAPTAPATTTTN